MTTWVRKYVNAWTCQSTSSCSGDDPLVLCPWINPNNILGLADGVFAQGGVPNVSNESMKLLFANFSEIPSDAIIDEVWLMTHGYSSKRAGEPLTIWLETCRNGIPYQALYTFQMPYNVSTLLYWSWTVWGNNAPFIPQDFDGSNPFWVFVRVGGTGGGAGKAYPRTIYVDDVFLEVGYSPAAVAAKKRLLVGVGL